MMDSAEQLKAFLTARNGVELGSREIFDDAYDFICETYHTAEVNGIIEGCCIFADNLAKVTLKDENAVIRLDDSKPISSEYRNRLGWEMKLEDIKKGGRTRLFRQLNELVNKFFGLNIKMISADVKYLEKSLIQTRNYADFSNGFIRRTRKTIVNRIMHSMYVRLNQLPYQFQRH